MPKCPECFAPMDLRPVWKIAGGGRFNFIGRGYGVTCPYCDTRCQILEGRSKVVATLLYGTAIPALLFIAFRRGVFETWSRWEFALAGLILLTALGLVQR